MKKIIIKLHKDCDKCRTKAMKLAAKAGVDSVSIEGENREQLVMVGDHVDPVTLTKILRKKVGRQAEIVEMEEVRKLEKETQREEPAGVSPIEWNQFQRPSGSMVLVYEKPCYSRHDFCSIL